MDPSPGMSNSADWGRARRTRAGPSAGGELCALASLTCFSISSRSAFRFLSSMNWSLTYRDETRFSWGLPLLMENRSPDPLRDLRLDFLLRHLGDSGLGLLLFVEVNELV